MGLREEIRDGGYTLLYNIWQSEGYRTCRQMTVTSSIPLHILLSSDGNPGYEIPREIIPKYKEISTDISFIYFILLSIINNTRNPNIRIIRPSQNIHIKIGSFISAPSNPSSIFPTAALPFLGMLCR